jgi:L-fuconolactonase
MAPIIDAHHHLWDLTRFDYPWISPQWPQLRRNYLPEDLKREIDLAGVDRTILVQTGHSMDETRWFLDMAEASQFIAGVIGWVDLTDPDLDRILDEFAGRSRLVGIRHVVQDEPDDNWIIREDVLRGLSIVESRGLSFDLLFFPRHLRHVPALAQRLPNLPMVIDHLAKPPIRTGSLAGWDRDLRAASQYPNICCKLSGMITEADWSSWKPADLRRYVAHAVDCFGFDRLMFGTDWPVCLLAGSYQQVLEALREALGDISPGEREAVLGRTAARFYRLI